MFGAALGLWYIDLKYIGLKYNDPKYIDLKDIDLKDNASEKDAPISTMLAGRLQTLEPLSSQTAPDCRINFARP